ncbi:MAG: tRNA epoxyqueuosine(34) reductase QueG [Ignavibacteria bacterium]|nr:tRNA epoxyqueuosine(34) reductase QueG [Ignavibacteria bacterium]
MILILKKMMQMLNDRLSIAIKQMCAEAGFIKTGFSGYEILKEESGFLRMWLDKGLNAGMQWMHNSFEKRRDPSLILEDVKSVISLAYFYDTPAEHNENIQIPKISRYAWGKRDYHKILKKKLKQLCMEIEKLETDIRTKSYIDDGPVMDKVWAQRSGIGWIGKNTNVINKEFGSYFFIATIFINRELNYDKPVEDLCGSCNLCIEACPTGALFKDYNIDSNLCISYQTIENRGDIPADLNLNGWIFGCDICQEVCPFTRNKFFTNDENFYPSPGHFNKTYDELNGLSEDDFNNTFNGTPVKRTKYKGWQRNLKKAGEEIS